MIFENSVLSVLVKEVYKIYILGYDFYFMKDVFNVYWFDFKVIK